MVNGHRYSLCRQSFLDNTFYDCPVASGFSRSDPRHVDGGPFGHCKVGDLFECRRESAITQPRTCAGLEAVLRDQAHQGQVVSNAHRMNVSQSQLSAFQNPLSESSLRVRPFSSGLFRKSPAPHGGFVINNLKQKLWFCAERFGGVARQSFEHLRSREVGRERSEGECQDSWICLTRVWRNSEILNKPFFSTRYPPCVLLVPCTDCRTCRSLTGLRQGVSAMDGKIFVQRW